MNPSFNIVWEYFSELETEGYDVWECYNNGCFAKASTIEGLKISQEAELTDGDKAINDELKCIGLDYEGMIVHIGKTEIKGEDIFFVEVKDPKTGRIGMYPDPKDLYGKGQT